MTRGKAAAPLKFLRSLVEVDGVPMTRNQNQIIKALHEKAAETIISFNTDEEKEMRDKLIHTKRYKTDPDGLLSYHLTLVELLAACSIGMNNIAEVICSSIFPLSYVMEVLGDTKLPAFFRKPYAWLLDEVCRADWFVLLDHLLAGFDQS